MFFQFYVKILTGLATTKMLTVEDALSLIDNSVTFLGTEQIPIENASGRILATDMITKYDLPTFTQSAMDGFALNSEETINATEEKPVIFEIEGNFQATTYIKPERIGKGRAVKISTGASLPIGANTVVIKENAKVEGNNLIIFKRLQPWENVRIAGEEIKKETVFIKKGTRLNPAILATIASQGYSQLEVFKRPNIAIITTGNEVVKVANPLQLGQVYNVNEIFLYSFLKFKGYNITYKQHVPDQLTNLIGTIQKAIQNANVIITTGGVSVGEKDLIKYTAKSWDFKEVFWKIAQKPGKPLFFARRNNRYLLGLPGNPAATFICFIVYGIHLLEKLEAIPNPQPNFYYGVLKTTISTDTFRTLWIRCGLEYTKEGKILLNPLPHQASHMITNLIYTQAIAKIDPQSGCVAEGSLIPFIPLPIF